jgi:hypothetical protein
MIPLIPCGIDPTAPPLLLLLKLSDRGLCQFPASIPPMENFITYKSGSTFRLKLYIYTQVEEPDFLTREGGLRVATASVRVADNSSSP